MRARCSAAAPDRRRDAQAPDRGGAFRRINIPSINHKIYGERFVKARVLACLLSGRLPDPGQVASSS
jgi:hypothetical protein